MLISAVQIVVKDYSLSGPMNLMQLASTLVREGLPQAQGADARARAIVIAVSTAAAQTFLVPLLPPFARLFVPEMISLAVHGVEAVYELSVKKRD